MDERDASVGQARPVRAGAPSWGTGLAGRRASVRSAGLRAGFAAGDGAVTARQRAQVVAVAALIGAIALFLPFVSYPQDFGTQDATAFMPLPFVVHVPLALLGALMLARLAGQRAALPLALPDRGLSLVVAVYAVVALLAVLLGGGVFGSDGGPAPGIGFWISLAAAAVIAGVALAGETAAAPAAAAAPPAFNPEWVSLRQPMELVDGRGLDTGVWYLAVARQGVGHRLGRPRRGRWLGWIHAASLSLRARRLARPHCAGERRRHGPSVPDRPRTPVVPTGPTWRMCRRPPWST